MDENLGRYEFDVELKRREKLFLLIYLPIHAAVLPLAAGFITAAFEGSVNEAQINFACNGLGVVLIALFAGGFLRRAFDNLWDRLMPCIFTVLIGYMLNLVLQGAAALLTAAFMPIEENLNQTALAEFAGQEYGLMAATAIVFAPIVEETVFRGGLFGSLRRRNRIAAYAVTMIIFALCHVWQYVVVLGDFSYLLTAVLYLPAGFTMCWAYERTGSIWTPIFLHMLINWIGYSAL